MAELVDAPDSKSGSSDGVWVRFPLPAPSHPYFSFPGASLHPENTRRKPGDRE
jgi:hypothetical protein